MKLSLVVILFATFVAVVTAQLSADSRNATSTAGEDKAWERYKTTYKKKYRTTAAAKRKAIFLVSYRTVKAHNSNSTEESHQLKLNQFADWTPEEINQLKSEIDTENYIPGPVMDDSLLRQAVPDSVDLRNDSCMPPVKQQGMCGSCYTFAAITPMEYQNCKKKGKLVLLSEEDFIDCSQKYGNVGCNGGLALRAWNYATDFGVNTANAYPYEGEETQCSHTASSVGSNVTSWAYATTTKDENAMKIAVANYGPLAVSIDATGWELYTSGVFSNPKCSSTASNHAVVIVGYGVEEGTGKKFWIIRNSWGTEWGLNGYILLERGVNMCAVAKRVVYPTAI